MIRNYYKSQSFEPSVMRSRFFTGLTLSEVELLLTVIFLDFTGSGVIDCGLGRHLLAQISRKSPELF